MEAVFGNYIWIENLNQSPDQFDFWNQLPSFMQKEIKQYQKPDDQMRQFAGKILLIKILKQHNKSALIDAYQTAEFGKPFIKDFNPFNLSHSGQIAAIVWTEKLPIGLDVQLHRKVDIPLFKKQFAPAEMQSIQNHTHANLKFFDLWTKKESVIKAEGRGMHVGLHNVKLHAEYATIEKQVQQWFYKNLPVPKGYTAHVCLPGKFKLAKWEKTTITI